MEKNTAGVRKGAWTKEEDVLLRRCIDKYGEGRWHLVPARAGLNRCRKSCRLRWLNYLSPNIKRGFFTSDEVDLILRLHKLLGNRWSLIAGRIPGRTANDVKNFWNTHVDKKLLPTGDKTTITKSSVIKPRPRVITHKLQLQLPLEPTTSEANQQANEEDKLTLEKEDECIRWWGSLLDIAENENGSGGSLQFPGEEAPHQMTDGIHNPAENHVDDWEFLNISNN